MKEITEGEAKEINNSLTDSRKNIEESHRIHHYSAYVLEAILVASTSDESFKLPALNEFMLSEIVNGTISYLGGDAGRLTYSKNCFDIRDSFEKKIWEYFSSELKLHADGKLDPKIRDALEFLCKEDTVICCEPLLDSYSDTWLYKLFSSPFGDGICSSVFSSTFSLSQEVLLDVSKNILPSLSESERKDIDGIGKSMRKFIDDDLKYINGRYMY